MESDEEARLAPWAMPSSRSRGREHHADPDLWRMTYHRDRDRIIHARAFRRLAYKTQVFVNEQGDLFRSRLTHTMEVVQLARTAARRLRLNEDLAECVALVHDLGHPPFGHRGEDLLAELMADHGGFEHNMQALRIVEQLEQRYPDFPGINLSYEVRESIVKHSAKGDPSKVPLRFRPEEAGLLEAVVADEVDSIAYDCHDIDDGLRAGILNLDQLQDVELWRGAWQQAVDCCPRGTDQKLLVDRSLRILMDALLSDLVEQSETRISQSGIKDLSDLRQHQHALVGVGPTMAKAKQRLEEWLLHHCYRNWRVNRTFHTAQRVLQQLFEFYTAHADALPDEHQQRIPQVGLHRTVADYLSGMTDRYALDEHQKIFR